MKTKWILDISCQFILRVTLLDERYLSNCYSIYSFLSLYRSIELQCQIVFVVSANHEFDARKPRCYWTQTKFNSLLLVVYWLCTFRVHSVIYMLIYIFHSSYTQIDMKVVMYMLIYISFILYSNWHEVIFLHQNWWLW